MGCKDFREIMYTKKMGAQEAVVGGVSGKEKAA